MFEMICAGSLFVEFGHPYAECSKRETCKRWQEYDRLSKINAIGDKAKSGWLCGDDYAEHIPVKTEIQLDFFEVQQ